MLNLNLWIFISITSRGHQGLITYESCIQNSAHSIFLSFACHLFPSACGHPGWCQAILYYIGFLGGGKSAGKRTGANSGQTNSGLENKHRIYSTEIHVTVEGIESSGSCTRLQERKRENSCDEFLEMIWVSNVLSFAWKGRYTDWMEKKEKISVVWMCFMHRFGDSKRLTFEMKLCANCFVFLFPS